MIFVLVSLFSSLPLIFYIFSKWRYTYWKRTGVVQLKPEFFYGDMKPILKAQTSIGERFKNIYFTFKEKKLRYGGVYWIASPHFVPIDPQLLKDIMLNSFSHFQDRGLYNHKNDILSNNLLRMEGEAWKQLRTKLTPTFTSSKMKMMFETLLEKNQSLMEVADQCVQKGSRIEVKDVTSRYTTDVIGSCAFGIECNSLKDPNCEFRVYGKKINAPRMFKQWAENLVPKGILGLTGYRSFPELEDFFKTLVKNTIEHREKNNIYRKDFMHLMIQLRNRGVLTDDGKLKKEASEQGILTDDELVAQSFIFFGAGFDTSSATMSLVLYQLAKHPDIQDKVRQEMREWISKGLDFHDMSLMKVVKKCGGELTYEGAKEMELTERVIQETLRMYPVVPNISRVCTKPYKVPGSDIVLEKGTMVQLPFWGIHMDPEYYPNPEVWDPERFTKEEKDKRPEFTYFPFGEGPRVCIGARFGMMQAKVGLLGLLKGYRYSICEDTPDPIIFVRGQFLLHPKDDIWLKVSKISSES